MRNARFAAFIAVIALASSCMPAQQKGRFNSSNLNDPGVGDPGDPSDVRTLAKNTELRLTLGTRWMVSSTLADIFGADTALAGGQKVSDVLKTFVLDQPASFGGPCDPYANSHPVPVKDSRGDLNRVIEKPSTRGCADASSSQAALVPSSSTSRLAWNTRACDRVIASDAAVRFAATQAGLPASAAYAVPNEVNIRASYDLFYPGQELASAAYGDLQAVVGKAAGLGGGPVEAWRFLFLTLCLSPGWQIL